jgi:hypothetical protein
MPVILAEILSYETAKRKRIFLGWAVHDNSYLFLPV